MSVVLNGGGDDQATNLILRVPPGLTANDWIHYFPEEVEDKVYGFILHALDIFGPNGLDIPVKPFESIASVSYLKFLKESRANGVVLGSFLKKLGGAQFGTLCSCIEQAGYHGWLPGVAFGTLWSKKHGDSLFQWTKVAFQKRG